MASFSLNRNHVNIIKELLHTHRYVLEYNVLHDIVLIANTLNKTTTTISPHRRSSRTRIMKQLTVQVNNDWLDWSQHGNVFTIFLGRELFKKRDSQVRHIVQATRPQFRSHLCKWRSWRGCWLSSGNDADAEEGRRPSCTKEESYSVQYSVM